MPVIIEEFSAEIDSSTAPQRGSDSNARPVESAAFESVADALNLIAERNARLAAD